MLFTWVISRWNRALADFQLLPREANCVRRKAARRCCLRLGCFLRLGETAPFAWLRTRCRTRVLDCWQGSAVVDSAEPSPGTSVTLVYKDWNVHFRQKGIYRIDAEPPRLWVQQGVAEVSSGATGAPVSVGQGMYLPLAAVLVPESSIDVPGDALTDWAKGRSESISADNAITAQIDEDPASRDPGLGTDNLCLFSTRRRPFPGLGFVRWV